MISRRGLVRGISSLTIGGVLGALPGTAAATPPDPTSFHATGRTADAGTTLTARLDPALLETVGLPASVGAIRSDLRDRYPSIDPAAFGPVLTSTGIDGDRVVSGCAVAEGPVNDEFRQALSPASSEAFDDAGFGTGFEHGSVPEPGYAVGVTDSTLAVGYGPSDAAAIDHAASGARHATGNAGADRVAPAELSGDAVAYVTLGDEARSRLQSRRVGSDMASLLPRRRCRSSRCVPWQSGLSTATREISTSKLFPGMDGCSSSRRPSGPARSGASTGGCLRRYRSETCWRPPGRRVWALRRLMFTNMYSYSNPQPFLRTNTPVHV